MHGERKSCRRHHGFERPWCTKQILVVLNFLISFICAVLCICTIGFHDEMTLSWTIGILCVIVGLMILFSIVLALYVYVSMADTFPEANLIPGAKELRCLKCDLIVNKRIKHCHICQKCTEGFDHHCLYLNTCIGKKNIVPFRWLIGMSILYLLAQETLAFITVLSTRSSTIRSIIIAFLIPPCIGLLGLIVLGSFQYYIYRSGMTTYEFAVHLARQKQKPKEYIEISIAQNIKLITRDEPIQ
ncbi:hypothetical protein THRCLA_06274 [Thraustotheca clavata]|uniref:Palmitoyltransferase n=1 Tax=Thraustotheca clavata TaxID=74557 RepID=A0A1V9ZPX9_9STRA|nr:hypothetical protein THRCLA_06274 [Thraustotheca clavata]